MMMLHSMGLQEDCSNGLGTIACGVSMLCTEALNPKLLGMEAVSPKPLEPNPQNPTAPK